MRLFDLGSWPTPARLILSFVLGGLTVLAFAPFGFGLLALPTLVLFLRLLWQASGVAMGAAVGYAFGLGLMGFGVFWLRISINQFGGVTPALAIAATCLFVMFVALYYAGFGALLSWLQGRKQVVWMLLFAPSCWGLLEWLRGWLFTGFPWLSIGYSQLDQPLAGFAPLLGVFGVGWLLLLSAGLLNLWRRRWALPALAVLWLGGFGLYPLEWTRPVGEPVPVALIQGNVPQEDKWKPALLGPTLELYLGLSKQAPEARLVVWPETAIPGFEGELDELVLQPLQRRFASEGRDLITGIVAGERHGEYYNAMIALGGSGRGTYYKRHLVPFGEYLPFKPLLQPLLDFMHVPMSNFSSGGDRPPLLSLAGSAAAINICYEDAFADEVLRGLPQAHFLINVSNDAWFGDSLAPHQHLQIARMRSLETGRPMLRATNNGVSAVIAADGSLVATAPQFREAVLSESIQPRQGMTPYARWQDLPMLLAGLLVLGMAALRRERKSGSE